MTDANTNRNFFTTVLSTVPSSTPLEFVVVYDNVDFNVRRIPWEGRIRTLGYREDIQAKRVQYHQERFELFREMYRVREFRLVLCMDVANRMERRVRLGLERIVMAEKAKGGFDYLRHEPSIISDVRVPHHGGLDWYAGEERVTPLYASAL